MSELWLTPDEVRELTDKKRWTAQCRQLARMGVEFEPNAVGRPLVLRSKYDPKAVSKPRKKVEPNWDAMKRVA